MTSRSRRSRGQPVEPGPHHDGVEVALPAEAGAGVEQGDVCSQALEGGYDGGPMAAPGLVDHLFVVPSSSVHRIQEVQASLYLRLASLVCAAL